ncbi:hypothetical protein V2H45_02150 [Tumidithrix elongata RA019]|uniref:Uncharacterized protein n=1 Tax=Tumidithrix elongata BACA0141 TaxID=2716417 RepID=A0AAW9PYH7_9CYAN|nr:hypothetical protein [Tumidithrix elongata RA019]
MMQKLRFTKLKRSPVISDTSTPDKLVTDSQASNKDAAAKHWSQFIPSLWFLAEIGGLIFVLIAGMNILTLPSTKSNHASICQSKLTGQWQTNLGALSFEEKGNSDLVGQYEFYNLNRGKVKGQISGKLDNATFNFDWQENAEKDQSQQHGKGAFTFSENCQEFTGSYGTGSITNTINWQGKIVPAASKPASNAQPTSGS